MFLEKMTSQFVRFRPKYGIGQFCINFMRIVTLWLCAKLGIALLPAGCRPIPIEHLDFNRDLANQFGGKDGVHVAVVYQHIANYIVFNERSGRNFREGRTWSYNSGGDWAKSLGLWTQETVEKHIRRLRDAGLLDSKPMNAHKGNQTLWYAFPPSSEKDSHAPRQMSLWGDSKTPVGGGKDSTDSSLPLLASSPSSISLPSSSSRAHVRVHTDAGGVAQFPKRDLDPKEGGEPKAVQPEARDSKESQDGGQHEETPPSSAPPSPKLPEWMPSFFTGCAESELLHLLDEFTEPVLLSARTYAESPDRRIDNPAGFVRAQLAKGWRPPVAAPRSGWRVLDGYGDLPNESTERLQWIVSDDCDWTPIYKAEARRLLDQRLAVR